MSALYETLRDCLRHEAPVALATIVARDDGDRTARAGELGAKLLLRPDAPVLGSLGDPGLDRAVTRDLAAALELGRSATRRYGPHGESRQAEVTVFLEAFAAPAQMVIFGAMDFSAALARLAKLLGYRVSVCDARAVFATAARFPMADEVAVEWPDRHLARVGPSLGARDAVCVLTHDVKFDVPAILGALATGVGYIGAMGSRRTVAARERRLREAGVTAGDLARVRSPIGLDIGARTPEETAVSICAEIIAARANRRAGEPLSAGAGPIHAAPG